MNQNYILSIIMTIFPAKKMMMILVVANLTALLGAETISKALFISCGLPKSSRATLLKREWKSDDDPSFAPPNINTISISSPSSDDSLRFNTARLFSTPLTYNFSLSPGPKFLRLYFSSFPSYNNIQPSQFFISLQANQLIIFKNFNPYLNSPLNNPTIYYEFHLTVDNILNLTFSPGDGNNTSTNSVYGFINAIEIVPVPEGLYINTTTPFSYVDYPGIDYTLNKTTALQTMYRLNVGGSIISPSNDAGMMWRTWTTDKSYLFGSFHGTEGGILYGTPPEINYTRIPTYVAPDWVYVTERIIGDHAPDINLKYNLTWKFEVDPGFSYLMRLHFCEVFREVNASVQRLFEVYIDSWLTSAAGVDVWKLSRGLGVPIYLDYFIRVEHEESGGSGSGSGSSSGGVGTVNGTKVPLFLALRPLRREIADVLLNGLEIFKFNEDSNSLAAPNPPQVVANSPVNGKASKKPHSITIIGGAIGGATLVFLFICAGLFVYKWRVTNNSSNKWPPNSVDLGSTASIMSSSLPSDLCRRFSFTEIRVATRDFDESLIVGKGGFGMVYKGYIDGGATTVAVKRLNSTSKQGAREFQTEIEMLTRLRHVHLVSLIGYCEDEGEMILVYEYMPQGTLRDRLMYKMPEKIDSNSTPLSWKQRLRICVGSASGLHYLHAGAKQLIIHRDVKSTNILLDDKWKAKVSDFGLSKVGPTPGEPGGTYVSTAVKGSAGYLDPEYYLSHQLTVKSDVYSFGVVLFEILCARAAVNPNLPREQANLAMWARSHYKRGTLHNIVDPSLSGQIAPESLRKFGEIAAMCVRDQGSERPSMGDVVWGLEFALQLQETAENNNTSGGGTEDKNFDQSSYTSCGGDGGTTDNEVFSGSQSSVYDGATMPTKRLLLDSSSSSTFISSEYTVDHMKSSSVFSEIIDPTAR